jgi:hypothetical protein
MTPDLNPANYLLDGANFLIQYLNGTCLNGGPYGAPENCYSPTMQQKALTSTQYGSRQASEVIVPQWVGHAKMYYRLPQGFTTGLTFNTGSYRDYWNPARNGDVRTFNAFLGRSW